MGKPGLGVGIVGTGACLPDEIRTNAFWPESWRRALQARLNADLAGVVDEAARREQDIDPEVAHHAMIHAHDPFRGTRERRILATDQSLSDLEASACRGALRAAGVEPGEVDCLMGYSLPTDMMGVGNHGPVAHKLGLRADLLSYDLDAGCASFMPQLRTAVLEIATGQRDTALLYLGCGVSRLIDYDTPASVLNGDGAVAAVAQRVEEGAGYIAQATITLAEMHRAPAHRAPRGGVVPGQRCSEADQRRHRSHPADGIAGREPV